MLKVLKMTFVETGEYGFKEQVLKIIDLQKYENFY